MEYSEGTNIEMEEVAGTLPTKSQIKWRNPYDTVENAEYDIITSLDCSNDPGMTQQAPAEEQDINVIMRRFGIKDGSVRPFWTAPAEMYNDVSDVPNDPVEAQEYLRQGQLAFMRLPAEIRQRFDTGADFYRWMSDDRNLEEARSMGLLSSNTSSGQETLLVTPPEEPKNETP